MNSVTYFKSFVTDVVIECRIFVS